MPWEKDKIKVQATKNGWQNLDTASSNMAFISTWDMAKEYELDQTWPRCNKTTIKQPLYDISNITKMRFM